MIRDGLLLVDKAPGMTSHDAVAIVRRHSRIRKIGHTGTLDPNATGLLVLCIGAATRLQAYLMGMDKNYEGTIQFGWATDTYDSAGTPASEPTEKNVEDIDFESFLERFRGGIDQVPPAFSAKKLQGVRAYELARKGESPRLEPKRVTIHELEIVGVEGSRLRFSVQCSAGTYVRSIAHELGEAVAVPAHLSELRRTAVGHFEIGQALAIDRVKEMEPDQILAAPWFLTLSEIRLPLDSVLVDPTQERKLLNGQSVVVKPAVDTMRQDDLVTVMSLRDELVAIAQVSEVLREGGGPVVLQPRVVLRRDEVVSAGAVRRARGTGQRK
ncbi:MAG TPA: tRNA pseudouridine(55) synthase TruB [Thermoanaerobaculia bacterium]|nr:tRNA pseudouridine(55) synthase TruB [Thermoanaerobaculia bacterium]